MTTNRQELQPFGLCAGCPNRAACQVAYDRGTVLDCYEAVRIGWYQFGGAYGDNQCPHHTAGDDDTGSRQHEVEETL